MKVNQVIPKIVYEIADMIPRVRQRGFIPTDKMTKIRYDIADKDRENIKILGSGAYSIVFEVSPKAGGDKTKAYKITLSRTDGYHKFVNWVLYTKDSLKPEIARHLPNIYDTEVLGNGVRITVLDKLKPVTNRTLHQKSFRQAVSFVSDMADFIDVNDDTSIFNVMSDNKRNRVITDPWSGAKDCW